MSLEINNLTKEFKRNNTVFRAVDNVSAEVKKGDFISIIGRSGSGKSTMVNMISGLINPTQGEIKFDGVDICTMNDNEVSAFRNSRIGYIMQNGGILTNLSVIENVRLPFYLHKREGNSYDTALELLKKVGIENLAESSPKHLSGGEIKRVAIARALINNPDYIFADEPTSDLDEKTTADIMLLFKEIAYEGKAVIIITHEHNNINFGNRLFEMNSGKLTEKY